MNLKEMLIEKYNLSPTTCTNCGKSLSYLKRNYKFCSRSCSAKINNLGVIRNNKRPTKICIICGKEISNISKKDKCKKCLLEFKINNNESLGKRTYKNYLIDKRGYKCEQCKNTHWQEQLIPLDTHHIDGNKNNNILTNLKLLCKNCHALTPNYGTKNGKIIHTLEDCIRDIGEIPFCKCGCKQKVDIYPEKYKYYKTSGYPIFLMGHNRVKI